MLIIAIIFITIQSNMVYASPPKIGNILASIDLLPKAFILKIGEQMTSQIFRHILVTSSESVGCVSRRFSVYRLQFLQLTHPTITNRRVRQPKIICLLSKKSVLTHPAITNRRVRQSQILCLSFQFLQLTHHTIIANLNILI